MNSDWSVNVLGARHEARIPSDAYHEAWVNEAWARGDAKSEARILEQFLSLVHASGSLAGLAVEHEAHRGCRDVNSARSPSDVDSEVGARGVLEAEARTTSDAHHEAWKQACPTPRKSYLLLPRESIR